MKKWKIAVIVIVIAGAIGAAIGYQQYHKPHKELLAMDPVAELTANEFFNKFDEDEAAANDRFLDQIVDVRGTVESVSRNGKTVLQLETESPIGGVICEFEEGADVNLPSQGKQVKVRGICSGKLMDVVLVRTIILEQ